MQSGFHCRIIITMLCKPTVKSVLQLLQQNWQFHQTVIHFQTFLLVKAHKIETFFRMSSPHRRPDCFQIIAIIHVCTFACYRLRVGKVQLGELPLVLCFSFKMWMQRVLLLQPFILVLHGFLSSPSSKKVPGFYFKLLEHSADFWVNVFKY